MDYSSELIKELEMRLKSELKSIIEGVSTTEIPLVDITSFEVGYFNPIINVKPSITIEPDILNHDYTSGSNSSYDINQRVNIYITIKKNTPDERLSSYQLMNYTKAIELFINKHLDDYINDGDIEFYFAVGADNNIKWSIIPISITSNVTI